MPDLWDGPEGQTHSNPPSARDERVRHGGLTVIPASSTPTQMRGLLLDADDRRARSLGLVCAADNIRVEDIERAITLLDSLNHMDRAVAVAARLRAALNEREDNNAGL